MLYFEGCGGVGYIVAIALAICPDDTTITIEGEVVHQGLRQSVMIAISAIKEKRPSAELILYSSEERTDYGFTFESKRKLFQHTPMSMRWEGCLSTALELALSLVGAHSIDSVRNACVDLIGSILLKCSGRDFDKG